MSEYSFFVVFLFIFSDLLEQRVCKKKVEYDLEKVINFHLKTVLTRIKIIISVLILNKYNLNSKLTQILNTYSEVLVLRYETSYICPQELRRKRVELSINLRKQARDEQLLKRRAMSPEAGEENLNQEPEKTMTPGEIVRGELACASSISCFVQF